MSIVHECPECGDRRVVADGDTTSEPVGQDGHEERVYYIGWWHCQECGHNWRYQDDSLNPN